MVIQRVMLIPYNEMVHSHSGSEQLEPSLMEKKLYKVNTNIQANLPSQHVGDKIKDTVESNETSSSESKTAAKFELSRNPTINEWINELKPHLSDV